MIRLTRLLTIATTVVQVWWPGLLTPVHRVTVLLGVRQGVRGVAKVRHKKRGASALRLLTSPMVLRFSSAAIQFLLPINLRP